MAQLLPGHLRARHHYFPLFTPATRRQCLSCHSSFRPLTSEYLALFMQQHFPAIVLCRVTGHTQTSPPRPVQIHSFPPLQIDITSLLSIIRSPNIPSLNLYSASLPRLVSSSSYNVFTQHPLSSASSERCLRHSSTGYIQITTYVDRNMLPTFPPHLPPTVRKPPHRHL